MKYLDSNGLTSLVGNIKRFFSNMMLNHDGSDTSHKSIRDKIDNINDTIGYMNDDEFLTVLDFNNASANNVEVFLGDGQ